MKKFLKLALIYAVPVPLILSVILFIISPMIFGLYANNDLFTFGILLTGPIAVAAAQTALDNGHIIHDSIERFLKDD